MYVASQSDSDWLQSVQRRLYARSQENPDYIFCKLWGFVIDPRNLRVALARVSRNAGARTAGVDGITVRQVLRAGIDDFVETLCQELRSGSYWPRPVRRVQIPKANHPGKFRSLGVSTVKDRTVQAAVKNIIEPIFEAGFYPVSYGFRPGKSVHAALEHLRMLLRPRVSGRERRLPYQVAIEGDIRSCFDEISHHGLMKRVRLRIGDPKVNRLVVAFLKAGVLAEDQFLRTSSGAPQGGILSPLLANIALSVIEERYSRHVWPNNMPTRLTDPKAIAKRAKRVRERVRKRGEVIFFPIRYADDFIILVSVPPGPDQETRAREVAHREKDALAKFLRDEMRLELSEEKTLITDVTSPARFLGHQVRVRPHPIHGRMVSATLVPRERSQELRERIKELFRRATIRASLVDRLQLLNPMLRGWGFFYRHAWGAKRVLASIDNYAWHTILRWLRKKHRGVPLRVIFARYGLQRPRLRGKNWGAEGVYLFRMASISVCQFKLGWLRPPHFA
jgi:group II intron reverse transcriptase/maturase